MLIGPDHLVVFEHRKMPGAALWHQRHALVDSRLRRHDDGFPVHEVPDDAVTAPAPGSDLSTSVPDEPLTDEAAESAFSAPVPDETAVGHIPQ